MENIKSKNIEDLTVGSIWKKVALFSLPLTVKKIAKKFLYMLILYTALMGLCSCNARIDDSIYKESKQYILNKSSKKIHISSCNSAVIMSDRNRKEVNDSLENLLNIGYSICKNCNAGIKKNFLLNVFSNNEKLELPTVEEYRNAIDIMGEWYVNHIPTYQTELETEIINDDNRILNAKEYKLKNKCRGNKETNKKYLVISTDSDAISIKDCVGYNDVLRAKENAVKYYDNQYVLIDKMRKRNTYYYPCDLICKSKGSYKNAGDDCVRFIFSILNLCDNRFVKTIEKESKYKWSLINTSKFLEDKNVENAFKKVGFEVYENIDSNCGNYIINDKTILEPGDLLVRQGHVHIYLGNYDDEYAFGWGRVYDSYPKPKIFEIKYTEKDKYYFSSLENDGYGNLVEKKYIKIYRYKGGK